jgi:hypothetical protein
MKTNKLEAQWAESVLLPCHWKNWCLTIIFPHKFCDICNMGCYDLTIKVKIGALLKVPAYLDRNIDKAFVFNELNIFRKEEYIFLFQKFLVLFVTNGVLQKYLRIVCITMIQNYLIMNSISVYWKKLTGMII